ncbi:hypothetical protein BH18ACT11_BH18ACT11_06100 [soil metagenome]
MGFGKVGSGVFEKEAHEAEIDAEVEIRSGEDFASG